MKAFLKTGLALLPVLLLCLLPPSSPAQSGISVNINTVPPVLPEYDQPPCPDQGYLWEPGYWAWGPDGYYWVPGVWVEPPQPGLFWTPGYWGFENGNYMWNEGYWGPEVGFYGGINYGFGYPGEGFYGGMWQGNAFRYNVTVWRVGGGFHNTYRAPVTYHPGNWGRASFNGRGGAQARPTPQDERAMHAHHYQPTAQQLQHRNTAARNPQDQYKTNHGKPQHAAMTRVSGAPARNQQRPAGNARSNNAHPNNAHPNNARPNKAQTNKPRPGNARPQARTTRQPAARAQRPQARHAAPARPQTKRQPKAQSNPASRPETSSPPAARQSHPEAKSQSRPAARTQSRSRPAARTQSRPKAQAKPRAESRPKAPEKPHSQS